MSERATVSWSNKAFLSGLQVLGNSALPLATLEGFPPQDKQVVTAALGVTATVTARHEMSEEHGVDAATFRRQLPPVMQPGPGMLSRRAFNDPGPSLADIVLVAQRLEGSLPLVGELARPHGILATLGRTLIKNLYGVTPDYKAAIAPPLWAAVFGYAGRAGAPDAVLAALVRRMDSRRQHVKSDSFYELRWHLRKRQQAHDSGRPTTPLTTIATEHANHLLFAMPATEVPEPIKDPETCAQEAASLAAYDQLFQAGYQGVGQELQRSLRMLHSHLPAYEVGLHAARAWAAGVEWLAAARSHGNVRLEAAWSELLHNHDALRPLIAQHILEQQALLRPTHSYEVARLVADTGRVGTEDFDVLTATQATQARRHLDRLACLAFRLEPEFYRRDTAARHRLRELYLRQWGKSAAVPRGGN